MSGEETSEELVEGRSCDGCTLCCKLLAVESLDKPRAVWCPHCDQKRGCKIYEKRPVECGAFYCGYRRIPSLDDQWKPSKAKFLINYESDSERIVIHVDPVRPDAWRIEPYYSTIKQWARRAAAQGRLVVVWAGKRATIIFPDRDKDMGNVRDDQFFVPVALRTPAGVSYDYEVVEPDDPRAKG